MNATENLLGETTSRCEFSDDRSHRYLLERRWGGDGPACMVIGLNPSAADETQDDPTIRRCIGFAQSLGFPALVMTNLYSLRSTDPAGLFEDEPTRPENLEHIVTAARTASVVVAAWGATSAPQKRERARQLRKLLADWAGVELQALAVCRDGSPRHPLYLHSNCRPSPWRPPA